MHAYMYSVAEVSGSDIVIHDLIAAMMMMPLRCLFPLMGFARRRVSKGYGFLVALLS